jgi:hypothetical protein
MRRIPDDNLAFPGLLTIGQGSGTSFFLNCPDATHLVTAHHVLFDPKSGAPWADTFVVMAYSRDQAIASPQRFMFHVPALVTSGRLRTDRVHDVAVAEVARVGADGNMDFVPGVAPVTPMQWPIIGVPLMSVLRVADVLIGNEVYLFGYPVSIGLPQVPQLDYDRPLLRRGIVAGKNPSRGAVIVDCPVYPGNSGGPVMQLDADGTQNSYRVFGVAIEFVPTTAKVYHAGSAVPSDALVNSGYAVVAAMDHVLSLLGL